MRTTPGFEPFIHCPPTHQNSHRYDDLTPLKHLTLAVTLCDIWPSPIRHHVGRVGGRAREERFRGAGQGGEAAAGAAEGAGREGCAVRKGCGQDPGTCMYGSCTCVRERDVWYALGLRDYLPGLQRLSAQEEKDAQCAKGCGQNPGTDMYGSCAVT